MLIIFSMKYDSYLLVVLGGLTLLSTSIEARSRRRLAKDQKLQADAPNPIQNQQPDENYDEYGEDYYNSYDENEEGNNRRSKYKMKFFSLSDKPV